MTSTAKKIGTQRGDAALYSGIRALGESIQAAILGQPDEALHQLEAARRMMSTAAEEAGREDDEDLAQAVQRAYLVVDALRAR